MPNTGTCPKCKKGNVALAEFCAACGFPLGGAEGAVGRVSHPQPLPVPDGFRKVAATADLYFGIHSAWGGKRLLTTENLGITLLNVGYGLQELALQIEGFDQQGKRLFVIERRLPLLQRGGRVEIEVPSYEIPDPPEAVDVRLVRAEYA